MTSHQGLIAALLAAPLLIGAQPVEPVAGPAAPQNVVPEGQEKLLGDMLGIGAGALPGGCSVQGVKVERVSIRGMYNCEGKSVEIALIEVRDGAKVRTNTFAIQASEGTPSVLVDAIVARVKAREDGFSWAEANREEGPPGIESPQAAQAPQPMDDPESGGMLTPAQSAEYARLLDLYQANAFREAFDGFVKLAGEEHRYGVLGMVVASLASQKPSKAMVQELTDAADAAPADVLKQFVAGVGTHYYAHQSGRTKAEKRAYYERALTYLERVFPAFDSEPRAWIYLGVSHFRLGHQAKAERAIDKAVALDHQDPDAFYCHAEIFQRTDIDRALQDLEKYLSMMEAIGKDGYGSSKTKQDRVHRMLDHLRLVKAGKVAPRGLFDPTEAEVAAEERDSGPPIAGWIIGLVIGLIAIYALYDMRRRRKPVG